MKKDLNFDVQMTNIIKGIALILMFASHLFAFHEWLVDGNYYISISFRNNTLAYFCGKFGEICVCMFMFLTGYGMYFSYQKGHCLKRSLYKVISFLLKYWAILFTFFLPIQLLLGRTYFDNSKWDLELFGVYTSIVGFAWYVRFYVLCLLSLPLLKKLIEKNVLCSFCFAIIPFYIICVFMRILSNYIVFHNALAVTEEYFRYMPVVLIGYCFAEFQLFNRINTFLNKINFDNLLIDVLSCIVIFILRVKSPLKNIIYIPTTDIIYAPIFILFIIRIINELQFRSLDKLLELIGVNSMNLWFLQSIFFFETNALQWIVYLPRWSFFVLIWNIFILLPISIIYNKIFMLTKHYLNRVCSKLLY